MYIFSHRHCKWIMSRNDQSRPITFTINIKTLSTSRRPLTCYINRISRQENPVNTIKPSDKSRSTIHLPVTYSSSIHVPCRPPIRLPSQHSYHHYHYHYYHHHHPPQRQSLPLSSRSSTAIKPKVLPRSTSIHSTPNSSSSTLPIPKKELPSYSTLVWNWFHHSPTKTPQIPKDNQSEYSEICHHDRPSKRSLLFKLLTSPTHKSSKTKSHRPCFTRKRSQSSSSLPNKNRSYNE